MAVELLPTTTAAPNKPSAWVYQAITATDAPRTALNWLRNSAGAALLTQMASGAVDLTHQALDEHPRPGVAGYLRAVLVANNVLPQRDEQLTAAEQFLTAP